MRRYVLAAVVTAAATALAGSAAACGAAAGVAAQGTRVPGAQLWVARFEAGGVSGGSAMAVSPAGGRVFVAGQVDGGRVTGADYETVAYGAATGGRLWASRYSGPGKYQDNPVAVAVSPAGSTVFVTGWTSSTGNATTYYQTVAYSAATGRMLWARLYSGPANETDGAAAVAVSPAGTMVFVTGDAGGWGTGDDYATVAYNAATGRQLWVRRYNGPANGFDGACSVAVSPGGSMVFVTGGSQGRKSGSDAATVAYSAATGRQLWVRRYNGPANGSDGACSVAVSPDGGKVFVSGGSKGRTTGDDYLTAAYAAATGRQLWVSRYTGPASKTDGAAAVAASPGGTTVFVTGESQGRTTAYDFATVAYNAATGRQLWASRYAGYSGARSVAVNPAGAKVYVTGWVSGGYATVAYTAASGRQLWVSRYGNSTGACCVAVSHAGTTVFVSGLSGDFYATVAYRG